MAVQTPDTKEEQDSAYNPGDIHAAEQFGSTNASAGIDQTEAFANDPANASENLKDKEETPDEIPFTGSGSTPSNQSIKGKVFGSAKKNSAITAIIGMLLTGAFGLSLLSPGLLLVQLKETMNDKFNDQLAALDLRQTAILKKKLNKTTTSGVCGKTLTIRCKYQTIGDRHLNRLEKAGIKVVGEKNALGRTKPTSLEFEGKSIKAPDLLNEARKNPSLRSAMRHGYNPKFAAFSDAIASKVNTKLLLKKSKNITTSSDTDKMKEDLKKAASGETDLANGKKLTLSEDGKSYYDPDDPSKTYTLEQGKLINNAIDEVGARGELASSMTKDVVKGGIKGALTVTALGAGVVDSACTVWNLIRVAGFAAKIYGQRQLIRYSYEFMKTADAIKAGDATPEEVSYLSTILTTPNSEGTSALDSVGYKYAAYGDTFTAGEFSTDTSDKVKTGDKNEVKNETAKYVNGQIIPDNAMSSIIKYVGGGSSTSEVDSTCGFVKSWQGQAALVGLAVAGAVVGFFTAGFTVGGGAVAQGAFSVAAAIAIAAITPKLVDMAKGELITGDENGNEAGNAITSGMGGYNAQTSQGRGLAVLNKQDAVDYARITDTVVADYNEVERSELSPLDATSKNTLVGSIVNSTLPYTSKLAHSGSTITSLASLVTSSLGSIIAPKSNADDTRAEELEHCDDPEYEGLAADPFCNLRYGLSKSALATDPEEVLTYMETGEYIEPESEDGAPGGANGDDYQEYIDQCIERENSIGDKITESSEGSGDNCIQGKSEGDEERNTMFRLFYIDMSVQEGMDSDFAASETGSPTTDVSDLVVGSYNILQSDNHTKKSKAIGGCNKNPVPGDPTCGKTRAAFQAKIITGQADTGNPAFDIFGTQETSPDQFNELKRLLPDYASYPDDTSRMSNQKDGNVSIFWNSSKLTKVEEGRTAGISNVTTSITNPWVGLETSSGKRVYVISIHYAVAKEGGTDESIRDSSRLTMDWVKSKIGDNNTVIVVGDFNDRASQELSYCVFTQGGIMQHAADMVAGKDPKKDCNGNDAAFNGIDNIYVTPSNGIGASKWNHMQYDGLLRRASDHPPVYAVITGLGTEGDTTNIPQPSKDGWVWPVPAVKDLGELPWGGNGSRGTHKGIDIGNRTNALGSPVVAAHDGTIVQSYGKGNSCGYYVIIQATGTPYWMGYQHLDDSSAATAAVGKKVKAGDVIGKVGRQGGSTCGSKGFFHLHFSVETKNTISEYADPGDNGTINPLSVLPR